MKRKNTLLVVLQEELAEVITELSTMQKHISKAIRFGGRRRLSKPREN